MATNQNQNENNKEEEVDLGSLFTIIGKGFSNFFNFIGGIFKGIFHFFITILIFLKKNSIKIGIAALIGLIAGFFLEIDKEKMFTSDLLLEPNFGSSKQLYNNIDYYNGIVEQEDTITIQKTFKIDKEAAGSLKEFSIEPIINEYDVISEYNEFIIRSDTLTASNYSFNEFVDAFTNLDYRIHRITVVAEKKDVFNKLSNGIISSIIENEYFIFLKEATEENLNRTDSLYRKNLVQIDSILEVYMQVALDEAKKKSNGTNIDLGEGGQTTKELELFAISKSLNTELTEIIFKKTIETNVVNTVSNFQPIGNEIKGITENKSFQFALLGALLMISILMLIKLNTYLNSYMK